MTTCIDCICKSIVIHDFEDSCRVVGTCNATHHTCVCRIQYGVFNDEMACEIGRKHCQAVNHKCTCYTTYHAEYCKTIEPSQHKCICIDEPWACRSNQHPCICSHYKREQFCRHCGKYQKPQSVKPINKENKILQPVNKSTPGFKLIIQLSRNDFRIQFTLEQ